MAYHYFYFADKTARNAFIESVSSRSDLQSRGVCVANVANEVILEDGNTGFLAVLSGLDVSTVNEIRRQCPNCSYVCESGSPCDY